MQRLPNVQSANVNIWPRMANRVIPRDAALGRQTPFAMRNKTNRQTNGTRHWDRTKHSSIAPQTDYTRELQANGNGEWATTKHTYAQTDLTIRVNHLQGQCSNQIERATNERDDDDAQRTRGPNTDRVND